MWENQAERINLSVDHAPIYMGSCRCERVPPIVVILPWTTALLPNDTDPPIMLTFPSTVPLICSAPPNEATFPVTWDWFPR